MEHKFMTGDVVRTWFGERELRVVKYVDSSLISNLVICIEIDSPETAHSFHEDELELISRPGV